MSITTVPVSETLRARANDLWNAQHDHPFVQGLGDGTLDPDRFAFWLRQDYLYLIDYARVFALAAARSPDLATMSRFASLLHETLETEMGLHRALTSEFGTTADQLEREAKAPETQGYTDFLLRTAAVGDFAELVAALLPCMWAYSEIGQVLRERGLPDDPRFARWVASYSDPAFAELAGWCRTLLDRQAQGLGGEAMARVTAAFMTSSRYELAFWDMGWRGERRSADGS